MIVRKRSTDDLKVDMTPMVDVVFLLLIFFMISTTFVETPGISVNLPESTLNVAEKEPEEIKVFVDRKGAIVVDDKQLTLAQLKSRLASFGEKAKDTTFVLMADKDVRHGVVVEVMDVAKQSGFQQLAIATEKVSRKD